MLMTEPMRRALDKADRECTLLRDALNDLEKAGRAGGTYTAVSRDVDELRRKIDGMVRDVHRVRGVLSK